ncbi:GNAT family acetyltransferase [Paenibacillus darwinianus]|uniref:hypothetical protein n=1 Tax=Paenibacillus darwinianus TaxID=1380763 RepID=UPI000452A7CC|nr:hypothetical protein [Paenibacillus darwinianus]EXX89889.1 GNAT family acetyltransferase [Paenibacillus darwinianus]
MEYVRIRSIDEPVFAGMHRLMQEVFPPEEVLAYELWADPLLDEGIHVYAAVLDGEVVGATEYRYFDDMRVAVTDFTIIGKAGLSIGRFLMKKREEDLQRMARETGTQPLGMFAEIYDPAETAHGFGGATPMNPIVRREVLSHMGYRKLDIDYVHPSWDHLVQLLRVVDLCFLSTDESLDLLPAPLITAYLERYYSALPNKPAAWLTMMDELRGRDFIALLPI